MSISLSGTIEPRGQTTASAILGSVDGANTAIAVVLGSSHLLVAFAILIAVSGALSMAQSEFVATLNEPGISIRSSIPRVLAMGIGMFGGTLAPCVPALLLSKIPGEILAVLLGFGIAALVGHVSGGTKRSYLISLVSFTLVAIPTAILAIGLGIGA